MSKQFVLRLKEKGLIRHFGRKKPLLALLSQFYSLRDAVLWARC